MNTATTDTPRVYIAVLADYNNGVLTGEWIDATDADDMRDEIKRILRTSKYPNVILVCPNCDGNKHIECDDGQIETCVVCNGVGTVPSAEEYAIHDYDGFGPLASTFGEYPDLDEVAHAAEMIEEHGEPWILWAQNIGDVTLSSDDFTDAYCGEYDTEEAYAESYIEEIGMLDNVDESVSNYFDYDAFARDLFMAGYTFIDGHVFRDN